MNIPDPLPELLYKTLTAKEEIAMRQWARDWYAKAGAGDRPSACWHPVILDELRHIDRQNRSQR
jgi:hypothetical protein